jgi:hypothetical protein
VWEEIPAPSEAEIKKAAAITVPSGNYMGKTLAQVAEDGEAGVLWLQMQLRKPSPPRPAAIETFVRGRLPEAWAAHQAWLEEQS